MLLQLIDPTVLTPIVTPISTPVGIVLTALTAPINGPINQISALLTNKVARSLNEEEINALETLDWVR